jgi:TatD DNase family protein
MTACGTPPRAPQHRRRWPKLGSEQALIVGWPTIVATRTDRAVAIGRARRQRLRKSGQVFTAHLEAARALGLPLVIHVIRAHEIVPALLSRARAHEVGGVIHSFSGSAELAKVYADLGFACSFAGPVTWPRARKPKWAAAAAPADRLLAETDCPDQSPEGWRGRRNEPASLPEVIAGLAQARGADPQAIAALTAANARRVFPAAARFW